MAGESKGPAPKTTSAEISAANLIDPDNSINLRFNNGAARVDVIVNLVPPRPLMAATDYADRQSLALLQKEIAIRQNAVLNAIPPAEFALRYRYENIAAFSGAITHGRLIQLLADPRVESVESDRIEEAHLAHGIPLMNATVTRDTYNGVGMSIAIVDTGIDYGHPLLGGGGFPNAKILGGHDFGDNDADPMDCHSHGTRCAGVAAGNLGSTGDYIGGVAFNARLYALKISTGCGGSAPVSAMVAAWDWCVTHKNDDPDNPILVISTSFGGGRYFANCDDANPSRTAAANAAVAAGITLLASAGNGGYCDSMSAPACVSNVISVGAVFDSDIGSYSVCVNENSCAPKSPSTGCSTGWVANDNPTAADKVTSYSNSAPFLDIFAPSNRAYTTSLEGGYTTSFGGTSAACPYAAGAVACLQQAARTLTGNFLTPTQVRGTLALTGDPITDTKVAITKPRVNLGNAVASICPCLGDVNRDGSKNGSDIQQFVNCVLVGGDCTCANVDQLSEITNADLTLFVNDLLTGAPCP